MSRRGPLRRAWKQAREALLDTLGILYNRRFYLKSRRKKSGSEAVVADSLIARYQPRRVVDLGCGDGVFLQAFAARGVAVYGLEKSRAGCALARELGVEAVPFDLRCDSLPPGARGDLCLCFEVAEHLEARYAERLVELVTAAAPRAIFTAAPPGQGGVRHVNEQPPGYWIARFAARGWRHLPEATTALQAEWQARGVVSWLVTNVLVFEQAAPSSGEPADRAGARG